MDVDLNEAVVIWTGWGTSAVPLRDDDRLVHAFDTERAIDLLPRVREIEESFYRSDAHLTAPDLYAMGEQAAAEFRTIRPDIKDDAVKALAWCYMYDYK